ncbi:hypothetical protein DAMA08_038070 [Martiniozyma asiatica (nom. inval.)]|nr:hypothetical protein DAMA08_038070 [Martiniozyma asiatica]
MWQYLMCVLLTFCSGAFGDNLLINPGFFELTTSVIQSSRFDYTKEKVIGVNLGGWLLTEPFISPTLYSEASLDGSESTTPIDEYNFCKQLGYLEAYKRLKQHWDTWITESDIIKIKDYGFNAVRIPVGYWAFKLADGDPYVTGQEKYLFKAIEWCRKHQIKMWIDLHGIPGSQNGFDNSGQRDVLDWITNKKNYDLGMEVLEYIYQRFGGSEYEDVIIGIQNLNEPLGVHYPIESILKFNADTYNLFNKYSSNNFVFHDAFMEPNYWSKHMLIPDTVLDHHYYTCFSTSQLRNSIDEHVNGVKWYTNEILKASRIQILGEWSAALSDCTRWLNGVGRGARYDNTYLGDGHIGECRFSNDYTKMTAKDIENMKKFIQAQLDSYTQLNGYFFWTWKTEDAIEWNLSALLELGFFPKPK